MTLRLPFGLLFGLTLLVAVFVTPAHGQDRETLTRICDEYTAANKSIRVGVLDKGETGFPQSNWNGVFGHIETSFLSRFGCSTTMTLYPFASLFANVAAGNIDFVFSNPLHGAQFEVQYGATVFASLTMQYTSPWNGRLPYAGVTASLDRFGSVVMYAHANMTKGFGNNTVPDWVQARRALIDSYAPQTYEDIIAMLPHFPAKNLTMCAVSATGLGGFHMVNYEFMKRGVVISAKFTILFVGSHNACIDTVVSGLADFTNIRTGNLEVYINSSRIDPGTFTVINDSPSKFFPLHVSTPLYPEWPVVAMPWIDQSLIQAFSVPLTALSILTNTPEAAAVSGASFSYPFSYDAVKTLMFDLNVIGDGSCATGWARSLPTDPLPLDTKVPHPCFACSSGTYVKITNGTSICTSCPLNTYNIGSGSNCTVCPTGLITHITGATSEDQCVEPTKPIVATSSSASTAILAVCIVCLCLLLICGIGVVILRSHPVMKAASPVFLLFVLLGLGLLCSSTIPRAFENVNTNDSSRDSPPSSITCDADIWLANLGYTLVTSSLLVKTWRLYSIFTSRQLAGRTPLSDLKIGFVVLGLMLAQCVLLLGLTQSEPMEMGIKSYDAKSDVITCATRVTSAYSLSSLYLPVIMVPRFALLIATTIAAFLVRNLPAAFNESSQLLYTMYNLSFFSVLLPAIDIAVGRGKDAGLVAYSVSVFIISLLTAVILFTPKFLLILRGKAPQHQEPVKASSTTTSSNTVRAQAALASARAAAAVAGANGGNSGKISSNKTSTPSGYSIPLPKTNVPSAASRGTSGGKVATSPPISPQSAGTSGQPATGTPQPQQTLVSCTVSSVTRANGPGLLADTNNVTARQSPISSIEMNQLPHQLPVESTSRNDEEQGATISPRASPTNVDEIQVNIAEFATPSPSPGVETTAGEVTIHLATP